MDEYYFDHIFENFKTELKKEGKSLPSISEIALLYPNPYCILISTLISLRTKDEVTLAAAKRLIALASSPFEMLKLNPEQIEKAIYPSLYYHRKSANILALSQILAKEYGGAVPADQKKLLSLPGVGIKTANLTLNLAFGIDAICVDCHVHQIANRMGWIKTKTPEESVPALEKVLPRRFWIPLNELLVVYGQVVCTPLSPFCSKCPEKNHCPKIGVERMR